MVQQIVSPPLKELDPYNIGEQYPGYAEWLERGIPWKELCRKLIITII